MKFTKMSLVAALLVGSSAFAIDNIKMSGDAKLYYATDDAETVAGVTGVPAPGVGAAPQGDLFHKNNSAAQAAASLSISADLTKGVSFGGKITGYSTLGLERQLVNNVWEQGTTDGYIVNDLWLAATMGKTTAKIGRMELDTPLVFTEKWSLIENTFESVVLLNQDIPDTTLVGAYVGGSNGQFVGNTGGGIGSVTSAAFSQFYKGAYAVGVVNNSWKPLTAQAWYYDATSITNAYWLQADLNIEGFLAGAQYTGTDEVTGVTTESGSAYALMLGYEMKDTFTAKIAYSQTDEDAGAGYNLAGTGQSKLYTEAWWNYNHVTMRDTSAVNVTLESPVNGIVDLGLYVTMIDHTNSSPLETTLTASKSFGPLDTSVAYIYFDLDSANVDAYNSLQAYLTYNF